MTREHYIEGVVSATELIQRIAALAPNPSKLFPAYPPDATGYYKRRGKFLDQCTPILARGHHLTKDTLRLANMVQIRPLTKAEEDSGEKKRERWIDYLEPYMEWLTQHEVVHIDSQVHVYSAFEGVQGTYDHKLILDGQLTRFDYKATTSMPPYTP